MSNQAFSKSHFVGPIPVAQCTPKVVLAVVGGGRMSAPAHVHFVNAYSVVSASRDGALASVFSSGICLPDGLPVVWALKLLDRKGGWLQDHHVRGPELFAALLDQGRTTQTKHYLLGGSETTLSALRNSIARHWPGAEVVGAASPAFLPVEQVDWGTHLEQIKASDAQLVWVGLGTPKQDFVAQFLATEDPERTYLAVGAAFDFVAGVTRRAPRWMQRSGLEWVFRLIAEPRRLWRRYLIGNPQFIVLVLRQWLTNRISGGTSRR